MLRLRSIFLENCEEVSKLEFTTNNYDREGNLILSRIPTLTTRCCEIGLYKNIIYFVLIIESNSFYKDFFMSLGCFTNIQIYRFEDFKQNLYPKRNFDYKEFDKQIKKDKYLQIEFDYKIPPLPEKIYCEYERIKNLFLKNKIAVINQFAFYFATAKP